MSRKVVLIVFLIFAKCKSQSDTCINLSTCGTCIQRPECVWCQNPKDSAINCKSSNTEENWCDPSDRVVPTASINLTEDVSLSWLATTPHIQMKPQRISLRLPKNQGYTIDFQFARAENPLDLYFLMDASYTMQPYKTILATLGDALVKAVTAKTTDFRLGFGSFVDKPLLPFDYPENTTGKCGNVSCERGYSFKNHLSLASDSSRFEEEVHNSKTAGNVDQPEGGLEALMQAIVCKDEIGWRSDATRIIIFATDDTFHVAGDGKLVGVMFPNDGLCHMSGHEYTKSTEIDYPSVSYLSHKAKEENIHIIFAIAQSKDDSNNEMDRTYKELSKHVELSTYGILKQDSKAIIDLVVETYSKIARSVKMGHNFPDNVEVDFQIKCPFVHTDFVTSDTCSDLKVGEIVDFRAIIKPTRCLAPNQFKIQADGIHDGLTVDLEVICECDCEKNIINPTPDETCTNHGHKVCGICACDEEYTGKNCECSNTDTNINDSLCIDPETNTTCSGHGSCECGICKCENKYQGKFCACENFSCLKNNNQLCSGEDHGRCECGKCVCLPTWSGADCSCPISNKQCIAPYSDGRVCSGKGECTCGTCLCEEDYFGDFCEACTGCDWCADLDPCVEAYLSNKTPSEDSILRINCTSVKIIPKENATSGFYDTNWSKCLLPGERGCNTAYKYKFEENVILVEIGEKTCPFIASLQGLLLAILLPILVGGMFMFLAWKAVVTYKDKREFANFLKTRDQEKWNTELNPLFKSPYTHHENPTFKKQA